MEMNDCPFVNSAMVTTRAHVTSVRARSKLPRIAVYIGWTYQAVVPWTLITIFFLFWTLIAELVINSISVLARTCPRLAGEDWRHRREYCWRHNHGQYIWTICTVRYIFVSSKFYFFVFLHSRRVHGTRNPPSAVNNYDAISRENGGWYKGSYL